MAKPFPTRELAAILNAMETLKDGAALAQISDRLAPSPNSRSLQRWIAQLINQGRLHKQGRGRSTQYFLAKAAPLAPIHTTARAVGSLHVSIEFPLSEEAQSIATHIAQHLHQRTPVGYNPHFLDSYRPNTTFYLPESTRAELLAAGQAANADAPAGTYARQIASRLLIDLSWNSSRLEGNTYSLLETERLLMAGEAASGRNALEAQMILNHKEAIEFLIGSAAEIGFNRYTLLNLHALLSDNLLDDPTASGRLRSIAVGIGHTVFHPLEGPQRIEETFQQVLDTATAIADPLEQAFFVMVHIPYLQPFEDVNKRLSRLAANISLVKRNLCPLSFVDVSQATYISAMLGIYELNRIEMLRDVFVWAYKRSCARYSAVRQSLGEPDPFRIKYRDLISKTVSAVVQGGMGKVEAIAWVQQHAQEKIPAQDQARFIEVAETQLMSLHEGNIARYRLRPSEFADWREVWK